MVLERRAEGWALIDPDDIATDMRFPGGNDLVKFAALLLLGALQPDRVPAGPVRYPRHSAATAPAAQGQADGLYRPSGRIPPHAGTPPSGGSGPADRLLSLVTSSGGPAARSSQRTPAAVGDGTGLGGGYREGTPGPAAPSG